MKRLLLAGRTRYVLPLTPSLARKFDALSAELELSVLGSDGGGAGSDPRFHLLPAIHPRALDGAAFYALFPFRLARELRRIKPDVVVVQGAQETALALLGRGLARTSARVVVDVHGDPAAATRLYGSPLRKLLSVPGDAMARRAIRRADGVRTISSFTTELVRRLGIEPVSEFPAYMDLDPFLASPVAAVPERPAVVFVGVLERYKAVDVLADAWLSVANRVPGATLHIVGRGSLSATVEQLVRNGDGRVRWSPVLSTPEVAEALDAATALVLPSRSEGLGRVVIEAFCRGRGVVGSGVGGIPDLVTDGENGVLVPPADAGALADALVRVLSDNALAERFGLAGKESVEPWLATPAEYAVRMRELVERVLAS